MGLPLRLRPPQMLMPLLITTVITDGDGPTDTDTIIMDILIIMDIIGMAREVQKKNLDLRDTEEVRMPYLHQDLNPEPHSYQAPHLDQMPLPKQHLKPMLMPQLGIMHITDTIHIIHMDIITPITGTDEDKKIGKKFSNGNFFSLSQQRQ